MGGLGVLLAVAARALPAMVTLAMLVTMLLIPIKGLALAVRLAQLEFVGALLTLLTQMEPPAQPAPPAPTAPTPAPRLAPPAHPAPLGAFAPLAPPRPLSVQQGTMAPQ